MKNNTQNQYRDLSAQIAKSLMDAMLSGDLVVDDRLPSEADLAETYGVSRPTVREALKRLAARSLIRTVRGAFGGAFVRQLSYEEAQQQHTTTATLLLTMNEVDFGIACEARFALEKACTELAALRCDSEDIAAMRRQIQLQSQASLSDEAFCESDVILHRTLVDAAKNPIMSYQLAGAVEAMQPLMNMITYESRSRERIVELHTELTDALEARDASAANNVLSVLEEYTLHLGEVFIERRKRRKIGEAPVHN